MSNASLFRSARRLGPVLLAALPVLASASAGDRWPAFQNGGNTSILAEDLPRKWSPDQNVAWSIELPGYGQSAPVIWKDRIFLTAVEGDNKETFIAAAFRADDGQKLWEKKFPASVKKPNTNTTSRAAPTPLVDDEGLYVLFESGDLYGLSHSGEQRWHRQLFGEGDSVLENRHGYGSSPTQTENAVIVLLDHEGPSYLAAFSKQTGKPLWKTERSSRTSWSSPQVARVGDADQVIVSSAGTVDGYDARTGKALWSLEGIQGNTIPSVTIAGDRVFVGASTPRGAAGSEQAAASNCCLEIQPHAEKGYAILWKAAKAVCHYVSPLHHQGWVYYVNNQGVLRCVDAETGAQKYEVRMGESCWAQPVACGEFLYFFGRSGLTKVIRAGGEYEEVAENRLWPEDKPPQSKTPRPSAENKPGPGPPGPGYHDPIVYAVAAVDGAFYVRLGTHLYCVRKEKL